MDGAVLHYLGDPLTPPSQTVNCRCRLLYASTAPAIEAKHARTRLHGQHPRDARGKYVELGGVARLWHVGLVKVIGELSAAASGWSAWTTTNAEASPPHA